MDESSGKNETPPVVDQFGDKTFKLNLSLATAENLLEIAKDFSLLIAAFEKVLGPSEDEEMDKSRNMSLRDKLDSGITATHVSLLKTGGQTTDLRVEVALSNKECNFLIGALNQAVENTSNYAEDDEDFELTFGPPSESDRKQTADRRLDDFTKTITSLRELYSALKEAGGQPRELTSRVQP